MSKAKIFWLIFICILLVIAIGFSIFLYFHGNTKPYEVPQDVHDAIVSQKVDKGTDEVRIMSSNLLVSYPSWHGDPDKLDYTISAKPRAKMFFDLLEVYKPDVVGLQELCDMWYNCILRNDLNYKFVFPVSTAFTLRMTSMIYNADTTTLLEKGQFAFEEGKDKRLRRVVWALFEDKQTKKKYIVTSTHLSLIREDKEASLKVMESQADELIQFSNDLKDKYNVPIFHTGDYNCVNNIENWAELYPWYSEDEIAKLNKEEYTVNHAPSIYDKLESNLTDAKLVANEFDSVCDTTINTPLYDHIFLNNDVPISRYAVISNPKMYQMSDHYSVFADAKIN